MAKNILVHLGGIDCTSCLRRAVKTETYGDAIATYTFEFTKNVNNLVSISEALDVEVWLDSNTPPTTKVFQGFINNFEPQAGIIRITAKDELAKLINRQVTKYYDSSVVGDPSYPDGKLSKIFQDLVETYGGLSTNAGATIQDSGTDIVLTKFTCTSADIFERCNKLAEALNWVFYYRADTGFVYFEPKNFSNNANTLQVGVNVLEIPTWEYDRSEMINDVTINGAQQLVQTSEVFTGDASTTSFVLANTPESAKVYYSAAKNYATTAKIQSEIKILDLPGSLAVHDAELDSESGTINFTSFVPAASTNNILVEYSYYVPIPVHMDNPASIATYGYYSKTINLTDVLTFNDAWKRGQNLLNKYSIPFKSTKLRTRWTPTLGVRVGQEINVVDTVNSPGINQPFTIYETKDYYPEAFTEISVGDKQYTINEYQSNVLERLKRLEEYISGTEGIAPTEVKQNNVFIEFIPESTVLTLQLVNDSFILNHPVNGILYAETETSILDDFESAASWTGANCVLGDDATAGQFVVGTKGTKAAITGAVTATLTKAITSVNISGSTGSASGTPVSGTVGLWVYVNDGSKISSISLKLGSDSSNYMLMTAETFSQRNSLDSSFVLANGLNYLVFDLPTGTKTGTPVWTATDYAVISLISTADVEVTFDYLTVSLSNDIGLNGLGARSTTYSSTVYTW